MEKLHPNERFYLIIYSYSSVLKDKFIGYDYFLEKEGISNSEFVRKLNLFSYKLDRKMLKTIVYDHTPNDIKNIIVNTLVELLENNIIDFSYRIVVPLQQLLYTAVQTNGFKAVKMILDQLGVPEYSLDLKQRLSYYHLVMTE